MRLVFTLEFLGKLSAYAKIQKVPGHFQHLKILILRCLKMKTHKHCLPTLKELMIDFEVHKNKQFTLYSTSKNILYVHIMHTVLQLQSPMHSAQCIMLLLQMSSVLCTLHSASAKVLCTVHRASAKVLYTVHTVQCFCKGPMYSAHCTELLQRSYVQCALHRASARVLCIVHIVQCFCKGPVS